MIDMRRRAAGRAPEWMALMAVIAVAGCATNAGRAALERPQVAEVPVVVENHHWNDVTVYRVQGGQRIRLGTVPAMSTRSFDLGGGLNPGRQVRLEADPLGGMRGQRSNPVQVQVGDELHWVLENELVLSSLVVR